MNKSLTKIVQYTNNLIVLIHNQQVHYVEKRNILEINKQR